MYDDIQIYFKTGKKGFPIVKTLSDESDEEFDQRLKTFPAWNIAPYNEVIPYEAFLVRGLRELTPEEIEFGRNLASQISIKEIKHMKFDDISKAKFIHLRDPENEKRVLTICYVPFSWVGPTETELSFDRKEASVLAISYSMCHPDDQYIKKIANHKSFGYMNKNYSKIETNWLWNYSTSIGFRNILAFEKDSNWNLLAMAEMENATNYRARQIARHHLKLWKEEEALEQDPNP